MSTVSTSWIWNDNRNRKTGFPDFPVTWSEMTSEQWRIETNLRAIGRPQAPQFIHYTEFFPLNVGQIRVPITSNILHRILLFICSIRYKIIRKTQINHWRLGMHHPSARRSPERPLADWRAPSQYFILSATRFGCCAPFRSIFSRLSALVRPAKIFTLIISMYR